MDSKEFLIHETIDQLRKNHMVYVTAHPVCSANEVLEWYGEVDFMINKFMQPNVKTEGILGYYEALQGGIQLAWDLLDGKHKSL